MHPSMIKGASRGSWMGCSCPADCANAPKQCTSIEVEDDKRCSPEVTQNCLNVLNVDMFIAKTHDFSKGDLYSLSGQH